MQSSTVTSRVTGDRGAAGIRAHGRHWGAEPALPRAVSPSREWRAAHLGVPLVVVLLRADPAAHQVVAHRVCQRKEVVAGRGHIAVLNQREVQVPVEALPHLGHVAQPREATHADLLLPLAVRQWLRHGTRRGRGRGMDLERAEKTLTPRMLRRVWRQGLRRRPAKTDCACALREGRAAPRGRA